MKRRRDINPTSPRARARATSSTVSPASAFRSLVANGFAVDEAGNLTALWTGLRPAAQAWSVAEINRLHFLLFLVGRDRIEP